METPARSTPSSYAAMMRRQAEEFASTAHAKRWLFHAELAAEEEAEAEAKAEAAKCLEQKKEQGTTTSK